MPDEIETIDAAVDPQTSEVDYDADASAFFDEVIDGAGEAPQETAPETDASPKTPTETPAEPHQEQPKAGQVEAEEQPTEPRPTLLSVARDIRAARKAPEPEPQGQQTPAAPAPTAQQIDEVLRSRDLAELQRLRSQAGDNPVAFLEGIGVDVAQFLNQATEHTLQTAEGRAAKQAQSAMEKRVEELQERLNAFEEQRQAEERNAQAAQRRQAHEQGMADFASLTDDATAFPALAAIEVENRKMVGEMAAVYLQAVARQARDEGREVNVPTTIPEFAKVLEGMFAEIREGWLKSAAPTTPAPSGSDRTSLTGSLASETAAGSKQGPMTDADFEADASEYLDQIFAGTA